MRPAVVWLIAVVFAGALSAGPITLGSFTFESTQFGSSLIESDGGTLRSQSWLNTANSDPGNPGALTGANFDSGIANIGLSSQPIYTILYASPILNGAGNDLGIVSARFSIEDAFTVAVSTDGTTFGSDVVFGPELAQATGENRTYFFAGGGAFGASLFVTPIDLTTFGIAAGQGIVAVRITSSPEGDLIRVAGFGNSETGATVPEPATWMLSLGGIGLLALLRGRRAA